MLIQYYRMQKIVNQMSNVLDDTSKHIDNLETGEQSKGQPVDVSSALKRIDDNVASIRDLSSSLQGVYLEQLIKTDIKNERQSCHDECELYGTNF